MFTKLRNKFLFLNMSITSLVMIAAFSIIYFITYTNIHAEIQKKLNPRSEMLIKIEGTGLPDNSEKGLITSTVHKMSPDDSLSFNIEVDAAGKIAKIDSLLEMPDEGYYQAAETAWHNKKNNSPITLEGRQWQYAINPVNKRIILGNGQEYISTENTYLIMFLDVTESDKRLFELLTTLLFVGLIMLLVIFIISRYFANRAIKPIAEVWEKQKQFVADASHELKTPLSIINANYDALLANQEETIISQIKWLSYIKIGTDRMTKLINELLSLAKIEDLNFNPRKKPFNISEAINEVIMSMEAVVLEKDIKLSYSIEPDLIIKGDPESTQQVVMILFDNALKYTNKNGQIEITLKKSKRQVLFSIKNSGNGIAKADLPKVFDRFYRPDSSRTQESGGYGLGLSIAKTVIDRLGGEIHVTSAENEYTTFTFSLGP
jgi:two-component system, OmpR family, sensor histidine kinase CiaH